MAGKNTPESKHTPATQNRDARNFARMIFEDPANDEFMGPDKKYPNIAAVQAALMELNEHTAWYGKICGHRESAPNLMIGANLRIPSELQFNERPRGVNCEPTVFTPPPAPVMAANVQIAPPTLQAAPEGNLTPLAQFETSPDGAVRNAVGLQTFMYFYGKDPVDAAADRSMESSRVRGGALNPNNSEGRKTRVTGDDVAEGAANDGQRGLGVFARTGKGTRLDHGEQLMKPSALVHLNADGSSAGTNRRFPFKPEENPRYVLDESGTLNIVVDGNMTISDPRRNDPYHAGFITDHTTATNLINQWNNTGSGQLVITQWMGLQEQYPLLADKFTKGTEAPSALDAEKLLQWNAQLAMHPVSWSVDSRGVPAADISVIQRASNDVLNSDRFKALPQADQDRLRSTYAPQIELYSNPVALRQAMGDISALHLPLDEKIPERLVTRDTNIPKNYYDTLGTEKGRHYTKEEKTDMAAEAGRVMSRLAYNASMTGPTEQAIRLGTGLALNTERQNGAALAPARAALMGQIATDAPFREDVANFVSNNPAALEKWTSVMFHATRNTGANSHMLGFERDGQADRFVSEASALLGGEKFKGKLDYNGNLLGGIANIVVQPLTLGAVTVGKGVNQRTGLDHEFTTTVAARFADTTTIEKNGKTPHDNVLAAYTMIAERAQIAQQNGNSVASTEIALSLSPRLAEDLNNGQKSALYRGIEGKAGPVLEDQWVYNLRHAGGQGGADVERGTERRVGAGQSIQQVDAAIATAAIPTYLQTGRGVPVTGANGNGSMTTLNVDAARAAAAAGGNLLSVLATANNPGKVTQGETDRETVQTVAAGSPLAFSVLTMDMLAGNAGLSPRAQKNLRNYVSNVDAGGEGRYGFSGYADIMSKGAKAIAAAGSDEAAANAARQAASAQLAAYFADAPANAPKGKPGLPGLAVSRLAGQMAGDGEVSATFDGMVGGPGYVAGAGVDVANGSRVAGTGIAPQAGSAAPAAVASVAAPAEIAAAEPVATVAKGSLNDADKAALSGILANPKESARETALANWVNVHKFEKADSVTFDNALTPQQLQAIVAGAKAATPEARLAAVTSTISQLAGTPLNANAATAAQVAGVAGASEQAGVAGGTPAGSQSQVAGADAATAGAPNSAAVVAGSTVASTDSQVAGGNASTTAGGTSPQAAQDRLAGLVSSGALTQQQLAQLLAAQAAPDDASRLAGVNSWMAGYIANEGSKNAHLGVSVVQIIKDALIVIAITHNPNNPDQPVIPGGVPNCTDPLTCPRDGVFNPVTGLPVGPTPGTPGLIPG